MVLERQFSVNLGRIGDAPMSANSSAALTSDGLWSVSWCARAGAALASPSSRRSRYGARQHRYDASDAGRAAGRAYAGHDSAAVRNSDDPDGLRYRLAAGRVGHACLAPEDRRLDADDPR